MNYALKIRADEVIADVRSAAWLEQELHPELDRHRRHQMADICEEGNIELVWRVLARAVSELRLELIKLLIPSPSDTPHNELLAPEEWHLSFRHPVAPDMAGYIKEKTHEYLVASVMADRTAVIIPGCSHIWQERADEARSCLRGVTARMRPPYAPARRPLWPL